MPGRVTMDQDMALWHLFPPRAPESTFTARQSSITKQASLGAAAELENDTLINRVQARAKAAAKNGSNSGAHAKSAPKKTHTAKAAPGKNSTQGNATAAATQSDSNSAPNIIGAELSGFSRWLQTTQITCCSL